MRVLHFILGKANKDRANGVNQVIAGLAKYSARSGAEVQVLGMAQTVERPGEVIPRDGFAVTAFSKANRAFFAELKRSIIWSEIVHLHGAFSPWNIIVGRQCVALGRPFVVTLHDGFAPQRLIRSPLRKKAFHSLLQRRHLESASAIHILAEEEGTELAPWFRPRTVFCIPNGIDLEDLPAPVTRRAPSGGEITLGYVGRLSQEKNVAALCSAVARIREELAVRLVLVGPDGAYTQKLLAEFGTSGTSWLGPKYGEERNEFICSIDLFVHPSLADVISIAAMEVLALGTPLLISRAAKVSYFADRRAFFMCEPTVHGLQRGISETLRRRGEWAEVARRGRQLVENELNWKSAAEQLLVQYRAVVGSSAR